MVDVHIANEILRQIDTAVEKALAKRDKAWFDTLHQDGFVDMMDADGRNKTIIIDEMRKRYNAR